MEEQREARPRSWQAEGERRRRGLHAELDAELGRRSSSATTRRADGAAWSAILVDGERVDASARATTVELVLDQTPFYAESGGQVGDTGVLDGRRRARASSTPRSRAAMPVSDRARSTRGALARRRRRSRAQVDAERRERDPRATTRRRTCCTPRCARCSARTSQQAGSLVAPDRLRFDFTHFAPLTEASRTQVEDSSTREILRERAASTARCCRSTRRIATRRGGDVRREVRRPGARGRDRRVLAASSAAARTCGAPATSASFKIARRVGVARACGGSRRSRGSGRSSASSARRGRSPARRAASASTRTRSPSASRGCRRRCRSQSARPPH